MSREQPTPAHLEPPFPFRTISWLDYRAEQPFDFVCLTRSPDYTPASSDPLFDVIRERFIDEASLAL